MHQTRYVRRVARDVMAKSPADWWSVEQRAELAEIAADTRSAATLRLLRATATVLLSPQINNRQAWCAAARAVNARLLHSRWLGQRLENFKNSLPTKSADNRLDREKLFTLGFFAAVSSSNIFFDDYLHMFAGDGIKKTTQPYRVQHDRPDYAKLAGHLKNLSWLAEKSLELFPNYIASSVHHGAPPVSVTITGIHEVALALPTAQPLSLAELNAIKNLKKSLQLWASEATPNAQKIVALQALIADDNMAIIEAMKTQIWRKKQQSPQRYTLHYEAWDDIYVNLKKIKYLWDRMAQDKTKAGHWPRSDESWESFLAGTRPAAPPHAKPTSYFRRMSI